MRKQLLAIAAMPFVFAALAAPDDAGAASLGVYTYAVSAQSNVGVGGPTATFAANYPGGFSGKFYPTTDGTAVGDEHYVTGSSGTIAASSSASGGGNSVYGLWSSADQSSAWATFGELGAYASGSSSGGGDYNSLRGSQAFALARETFTFGGGSGIGVFRPTFTIEGNFTNDQTGLQLEFDYRVNDEPTFLGYRIQQDGTGGLSLYYNGYVASLPGLTVTSNSVTGAAQISFDVAFVFGTPFDVTTALYAAVLPYRLGATTGTVDFASTARMTGISILQNGTALQDFTVTSGSGTVYTAQGAQVPLPASGALLGAAFGIAGAFRRRANHRGIQG